MVRAAAPAHQLPLCGRERSRLEANRTFLLIELRRSSSHVVSSPRLCCRRQQACAAPSRTKIAAEALLPPPRAGVGACDSLRDCHQVSRARAHAPALETARDGPGWCPFARISGVLSVRGTGGGATSENHPHTRRRRSLFRAVSATVPPKTRARGSPELSTRGIRSLCGDTQRFAAPF